MKKSLIIYFIIFLAVGSTDQLLAQGTPYPIYISQTDLNPGGGTATLYFDVRFDGTQVQIALNRIKSFNFIFEITPSGQVTNGSNRFNAYKFTYPANMTQGLKTFDFLMSNSMWNGVAQQGPMGKTGLNVYTDTDTWLSGGGKSFVCYHISHSTAEINTSKASLQSAGVIFDAGSSTVFMDGQPFIKYTFNYPQNKTRLSKYFTLQGTGNVAYVYSGGTKRSWNGRIYQDAMGMTDFRGFTESVNCKNGGTGTIYFESSYSPEELESYKKDLYACDWFGGFTFSSTSIGSMVVGGKTYKGYPFTYPSNETSEVLVFDFMLTGGWVQSGANQIAWDGKFLQEPKPGEDPEPYEPSQTALPTPMTNWTSERTIYSADEKYFTTNPTYYDGFGRPVEQHAVNASSMRNRDIISVVQYDVMGRSDAITYLPFVSSELSRGQKESDPVASQKTYYQTAFPGDPDAIYAYGENIYNSAGLVTTSHGPGQSSTTHPMLYEYRKNYGTANVKLLTINADNESLDYLADYEEGVLTVYKSTQGNLPEDQDKVSFIFTNSQGQTVAEMIMANWEKRTTYYVYDDLGRQRYIIPAIQESLLMKGVNPLSTLRAYCYYTEYDEYGRAYIQYIPGREPIYSLYDERGRQVLTQDGNQREAGQWTFTKYDNLDRPVMSGIYTGGTLESHRAELRSQTVFGESRGGNMHSYTNVTYPIINSANDVLTVNYYDDYNWGVPHSFSATDALENEMMDAVVGLQTGSKIKVLGIDSHKWLESVIYYDDKYQTIQSIADLYPSGTEIVSNRHNFIELVTQTKVKQTVGSEVHEYKKWFNYDPYGRLENIQQQITGDILVEIASYNYDDFGKVTEKKIHNDSETTKYKYNLSGVNTGASSPNFSYDLWFDKVPEGSEATGRHDGNLSHVTWANSQLVLSTAGYKFDYDHWGQMTDALYMQNQRLIPPSIPGQYNDGDWIVSPRYAETGITYDKNGNILSLHRGDSSGEITDYKFIYNSSSGNRLLSVSSGNYISRLFLYDTNGNLITDHYKGLNIEYNELDLPKRIYGNSGGDVNYIYSATGEKLAQEINGSLTYYRGVMVYAKQGSVTEQLLYMIHPEGTVMKGGNNTYQYQYFKTDHTGSTRAVLSGLGSFDPKIQTTNYYPFGLAHNYNNLHANKYLFGGKELQDAEVGSGMLGMYDFHARFYNPLYGRWFNTDPALQGTNPYLFCGNSPMMYVDPDGEFWHLVIGAVVGGVMNWMGGGAKLNLKGLASFGIGALSGALGSGIGSGVNVAMAGGSFGGGFMGTATGVASTGFLSGATAGATAGLGGGFTASAGNSWLGGMSFKDGLWTGVKGGGIGAFSGGILGGLYGGIDAVDKGTNFFNGKATFDLSQGVGAHGIDAKIGKSTITGKYVGVFEDTNVYEAKIMKSKNSISGITIPERGIIVSPGVFTRQSSYSLQLLQHEYGHILQYRKLGAEAFYEFIGKPSFMSATFSSSNAHSNRWYEKWANYLAKQYFGEAWKINTHYPIENIGLKHIRQIMQFNRDRDIILYYFKLAY